MVLGGWWLTAIMLLAPGQQTGDLAPPERQASTAEEAEDNQAESEGSPEGPPITRERSEESPIRPEWWWKVPRPQPFPKPGFFPVPPTRGAGYYTGMDWLRGVEREKLPPAPWPAISPCFQPLFELDYRKVDPPGEDRTFPWLDAIKRIPVGENSLLAAGGELRYRYMAEGNARLKPVQNDYDLFRGRFFTDYWYRDDIRLYAEFLTAEIWNNELPPVLPDKDPADFLDLFAELKLAERNGAPIVLRIGRQELLFGSQRLISPLDWANTRRTFQGVRFMHHGETDDLDVFWTNPVVPDPEGWGWADTRNNFSGIWWTRRFDADHSVDLYGLWYTNNKRLVEEGGTPLPRGNFVTLGSRAVGDTNGWLYDGELALQLGTINNDRPLTAGMATLGLGRHFSNLPMNPTAWICYDYASGSSHYQTGASNTFQQLFPFSHYYLGWADLVGRQNIRDLNQEIHFYPANWITFTVQHHTFWLASAKDALYFANGQPGRVSPDGSAGFLVGNEVDLIFNFHLGPRTDLLTGWSKLYGGNFLQNTGPVSDSSLTYLQISVKY